MPTVMANLDAYLLTNEGSDKLVHSDEVYEDMELAVKDSDTNELILYMYSKEHNVRMRYSVTVDDTLAIVSLDEELDNECRACIQEYNERVQLGRGGW
jgi:hypothetical protein